MWMLGFCLSLPLPKTSCREGRRREGALGGCNLGREVELWADPVGRRSSHSICLGLPHPQQPQTPSCLDPQMRPCSIPPQKQLRSLKPAALQTWGKATGSDGLCGAQKLYTALIKMAL